MQFASEEDKYDSTYFIPNYPIKEPVFYIPRIPNIVKVPEPKRPSRPPPPGYDMRTLRKQLEHLNEEFEEKERTQSLLYSQNEQLWTYIQDLLEANKANAQLMRGEVVKLHVELKNAHRERFNIAEKLQLARNSKQMLAELNHELHGAQLTVEEIEIRKREAEASLMQAREDNAHLEEALRTQEEMLHGVNNELDEFRRRRLEEQALDLADDFFYTNKAVLRAAYYRFRAGVQQRFKLSRIHSAVKSVYGWHLKVNYFRSWCAFLGRKRVMYTNQAHRRHEQLVLCMQQWKLYTVLEKLFTRSHRRLMLSRTFKAWRTEARESAYDKWALLATKELHTLQFKRKMFLAWKRHTMFLQWNNPMLLLWEQEASSHYLRRVLRAWAKVCRSSRHELAGKAAQVPGVIQWWHLTRWRELCESRWRRRGKLLRRFFRNMRRMVAERDEYGVTRKYAFSFWVSYRQRKALKNWFNFLRNRRMFISGPLRSPAPANPVLSDTFTGSRGTNGLFIDTMRSESTIGSPTMLAAHFGTPAANSTATYMQSASANYNRSLGLGHSASATTLPGANRKISNHRRGRALNRWQVNKTHQVLTHMKKRWLRSSMLVLIYATSVQRRQNLCLQAAMRHYIVSKASSALRLWQINIRREVRRRQKKRTFMLRLIMDGWKAFTRETKAAARLQRGLQALKSRVMEHQKCALIRRWHEAVRTKKRLAHCSDYLAWHRQKRTLRQCFSGWRGQWSKALYWQVKELQIEYSRATSLNDLNKLALQDLEAAHAQRQAETAELEANLVVLQETLADSNNQCKAQAEEIAEKEAEKEEALAALEALQLELRDVLAEQEQMRAFENLLVNELQQQEVERAQLRRTAAEVVARVNSETEALREEVGAAREHAMHAERQAETEILRSQQEVTDVQRECEEVQQVLLQKRGNLSLLEQEHAGVMDGLTKVQYKLGEVTRDGAALIAENEALIRSRGSAVRVLKSNAGLSEARVNALQDLATEFESKRGRMKLSEVLQEDNIELNELLALQRQIENGTFRDPASTSNINNSSPPSKGVSLYRNPLSAGSTQPSPTSAVLRGSSGTGGGSSGGVGGGSRRDAPSSSSYSAVGRGSGVGSSEHPSARSSGAGQKRRSLRTPNVDRKPSLSVRSVSIAAPTPPILTPHNQSHDQLLQQTHPYSHPSSWSTTGPVSGANEPGAMGASIFDLMHYNSNGNSDAHGHRVGGQASRQSREVPRASSINANSGSSGSAISYPAAVASPPRAYSPPTKQVNNYTTSTAVAGEAGAASKPLTRGAFFAESFITGMPPAPAVTAGTTSRAGAGGGSMSSSRPVLSTSPPRSPKSLCRVQPAPPRSPPTFLTAGRESSSDGENDDEEEEEVVLQHQQLPQYYQQYPQQEDRPAPSSHMRVGSDFRRGPASRQSLLSGQQSQEEFRHSIEVDILSKYEQTRRELKDAFRQPGAAERDLSLGSNDSPASHESEVDSERNPNEGQVGDYYYYDQGGGEDEEEEDGSSFDAEGYAEDAVDEAEFINDSSSDGSY